MNFKPNFQNSTTQKNFVFGSLESKLDAQCHLYVFMFFGFLYLLFDSEIATKTALEKPFICKSKKIIDIYSALQWPQLKNKFENRNTNQQKMM
jgi:hypothetical protein